MGTDKRERQKANRDAAREAAWAAYHRRRRIRFGAAGVVVLAIVVVAVIVFAGGSGKKKKSSTATAGSTASSTTVKATTSNKAFTYGDSACPAADGSSPRTLTFSSAPKNCLDGKAATATFHTTAGDFVVDLDTKNTPGTANNFVFLSRYHYFDNTQLFRIDTSIDIIQGGSPHTQGADDQGPGYNLPDEGAFKTDSSGNLTGPYKYVAGDLVMARSSGPNSGSAQFFLVTGANAAQLDSQGTYVVFGHVTSGMDVVQKIFTAPTKPLDNGLGNTPNPPITITTLTIS